MRSTFTMPSERKQPNGGSHVPDARPDAPCDATMELVIEGTTYPCKDGTLIGSASEFAKEFFSRANGLESRHLLLGKEGGRWFLFTPRTILRPFLLDGAALPRGERYFLTKIRHHIQFDDLRVGLRLLPAERTGPVRWANSLFRGKG